jgi:ribonuclease HII
MTGMKKPPDSLLLFDEISTALAPDFQIETGYWERGYHHIAGVDESGRGPLAGPVVAAAVILDPATDLNGLNDSKKMTARARDLLYDKIMSSARAVSVSSICANTIDATNILRASLYAMREAIDGLALGAHSALFDGRDIPPGVTFRAPPKAVIKGDCRSLSIAAASVVAKVTRDRMLIRLGAQHPEYGLEGHKGYGSQAHRDAIAERGGVVRLHRFTFSPLKPRM